MKVIYRQRWILLPHLIWTASAPFVDSIKFPDNLSSRVYRINKNLELTMGDKPGIYLLSFSIQYEGIINLTPKCFSFILGIRSQIWLYVKYNIVWNSKICQKFFLWYFVKFINFIFIKLDNVTFYKCSFKLFNQ